MVLMLTLGSIGAQAQTIDTEWVPDDIVVSNPESSSTDPEFDPVTGFAAWQFGPNARVTSGRLLVAKIDPLDGDLLDPVTEQPLRLGGRGLEVDRDLVSRELTKNGPEFAFAEFSSRLVYTKFNSVGDASLAQAVFDGTQWIPELLGGGENRITPEGSKDLGDLSPRIAYYGFARDEVTGQTQRRLGVRIIDLAFTERVSEVPFDGASFLPEESAMLATSVPEGGVRQVFLFDYDVETIQQITSDPTVKLQSPEPWSAPEIGGETLFTIGARSETETFARVYRRDAQGIWRIFTEIRSPDRVKPFLNTPVPFVYEGVSYLAFRAQINPGQNLGSDIWIVNVAPSPAQRLYRRISRDESATRYDQEVYVTDSGPIVYYTEVLENGIQQIRRCRTGITPGQSLVRY
jgi:hypothetical protein